MRKEKCEMLNEKCVMRKESARCVKKREIGKESAEIKK